MNPVGATTTKFHANLKPIMSHSKLKNKRQSSQTTFDTWFPQWIPPYNLLQYGTIYSWEN